MTSDPQAWPEVRALHAWLTGLRTRTEHRLLIGQQIESYGNPQYDKFVNAVTRKTGRTPALVGMDVHSGWDDKNFPSLLEHWQRGGLITMDWHPADPWRSGGYETAWVNGGEGARSDGTTKHDLKQLLDNAPDTRQRRKYQTQRDKLAAILARLATEGVVVILRPLHEANGQWFWWGQDQDSKRTDVIALYVDLWNHLVNQRHLHNLLWSYSPAPSWNGHALQYYPGAPYVDMIGPTRYDDTLRLLGPEIPHEENHNDWKVLSAKGKPIGYGEFGPQTDDGTWDARTLLRTISQYYPSMVFAHCWHGWYADGRWVAKELVSQRHIKDVMNDPAVISLENIDWRAARPLSAQP